MISHVMALFDKKRATYSYFVVVILTKENIAEIL